MGLLRALWAYLCAFGGRIAELFGGLFRSGRALQSDEDDESACANGAVAVVFPAGDDSSQDPDRGVQFSPATASWPDEPYREDDQT